MAHLPNDEVRALWESKAPFWDEHMAEGNRFQRELVGPSAESLLAVGPGELVLDACCGNGVFSRRLATLGRESSPLISAKPFWSGPERVRKSTRTL